MAIRFSQQLEQSLKQTNLKPILVLEIEGVDIKYTSTQLKRSPFYGMEGLEYGDAGLNYGSLVPINNQLSLITLDATTTSIRQELAPDKARGTSITSMSITLVDLNEEATKLVSGVYKPELLYSNVKVWVGFGETAEFNRDFIIMFRGIIESFETSTGSVKLNLNSPDQKRRSLIAPKVDTELSAAITNVQTVIPLKNVDNLVNVPTLSWNGGQDTILKTYVKIEDEYIRYTGISALNLTGCTRGQLGSAAAAHAIDTATESFYIIEGNAIDAVLKIMLSDKDTSSYAVVNPTSVDASNNSFYFADLKASRDLNVQVGDVLNSALWSNGANNLTNARVLEVADLDNGSRIIVDQNLVTENNTTNANISLISKYNTLGSFGIGLTPEEVDIEKHNFLNTSFLSSANISIYVRDEISEVKAFIEEKIYLPLSCYSLPNDKNGLSRLSVGLHIAPLPLDQIQTVSKKNIINPDKLKINRSINKNFYNVIVHKIDERINEADKFAKQIYTFAGTSQIPIGNKPLIIKANSLRSTLQGAQIATSAGNRLLNRYKSAAESIPAIQVTFDTGVKINVGDIIIFDPTDLNVLNSVDANRTKPALLMEVVNKSIDYKTGVVSIDIIDTSFNIDSRYGLIGPSSKIVSLESQTRFMIGSVYDGFGKYGPSEYRKWENYVGAAVQVRTANRSSFFETTLLSLTGNTIEIADTPSFTLTAGCILEFASYSNANTTASQKLVYTYLSNGLGFPSDSGSNYVYV